MGELIPFMRPPRRAAAVRRRILRRALWPYALWCGLAAALLAVSLSGSPSNGTAGVIQGQVTRVIDGDTLRIAGQTASIRLWGVDAPEMNTASGPASKAALANLVQGRQLVCEHLGLDGYGRILGRCALEPAGQDLAVLLFDAGAAQEYCYFSRNYYRRCR